MGLVSGNCDSSLPFVGTPVSFQSPFYYLALFSRYFSHIILDER